MKKMFFYGIFFIFLALCFELILNIGGYFYFYVYSNLDRPKIEEDAFRILFLGESTTMGTGVTTDRAYPSRVERILQQKYPNKKIKSYNKGIGSIETTGILRDLDRNVVRYKPNLVVLMAGYNDNFFISDDEGISLESFYSQFKICRLIMSLKDVIKIKLRDSNLKNINPKEVVYRKPLYNPKSKVVFNLVSIVDKVRSYDSNIWFAGYLQPDARKFVNPVLKEVAEGNGVVYVGDYPVVDFIVNRSLFVEDGWHPNKEGHRIIAEKIAEKMIEERVVEKWVSKQQRIG